MEHFNYKYRVTGLYCLSTVALSSLEKIRRDLGGDCPEEMDDDMERSTPGIARIISTDIEEATVTMQSCLKCNKIYEVNALIDCTYNNLANLSQQVCSECNVTEIYQNSTIASVPNEKRQCSIDLHPLSGNEYFCETCGHMFKTKNFLKRHCAMKHSNKQVVCRLCKKTYGSKRSLQQHVRYMHKYNHRCAACYKSFPTNDLLTTHSRSCYKVDIRCKICRKVLHSEKTLQVHMKNKHPKNVTYQCCLCKIVFKSHYNMNNHIVCIHPPELYCTICERVLCSIGSMRNHLLTNHSLSGV